MTKAEGWGINGYQEGPKFECVKGEEGICMAEETLWSLAFSVSFGIGPELVPVNVVYGSGLAYTFVQTKMENGNMRMRNGFLERDAQGFPLLE